MLIRNAKDTAGKPIEVWLRGDKIAAIGQGLVVPEGEDVLDAKGRTILPAFIDTHCHWRTPGFEYKEDIATGSAAAAAGGYTFVNLMPNTKPVCSTPEIAHAVEAEAKRIGLCDANQTVSITRDFDGKTIDHLLTLPEDIKFITEDGNGVMNNAVMARVFAIATERGLTVMSHAEDREISPWDYRLAENIETVRNCHLAEYYGTRLHMCHVSTKESIDAIRMSRLKGARVSCEVTPHHLWFDDSRDRSHQGRHRDLHRHRPRTPYRRGKGEGSRRYGGPGDSLRRMLHQALPRAAPAAGTAELFDERRPRRRAGPGRPQGHAGPRLRR